MSKRSAGILLYRAGTNGTEVLLVHPGGPFWAKRDLGAWSIPKGEIDSDEEPRRAALREFAEETGTELADREMLDLGVARQNSGKLVHAFAAAGDLDPATLRSSLIEIAWPPRSGRRMTIPEIDRAGWFGLSQAREKILQGQAVFLDRLAAELASD
jgi:predicted NUDIX family NTP pyrophosphohydrolase